MPATHQLTQEIADRICAALQDGVSLPTAAGLVGYTARCLQKWLARGRKADPSDESEAIFIRLVQGVIIARANANHTKVLSLNLGACDDWRAGLAWLQAHEPKVWGRDAAKIRELERRLAELEKGRSHESGPDAASPGTSPGTPGEAPGEGGP